VKVSAIPAGTPVAYGRIVEWKGKPEVDIFWGRVSPALFEKLAEQKLCRRSRSRASVGGDPRVDRQARPIRLKDKDGFWVGTALEPYGLVYHPRRCSASGFPSPAMGRLLNPKLKGEVAQCAPHAPSSSNAPTK